MLLIDLQAPYTRKGAILTKNNDLCYILQFTHQYQGPIHPSIRVANNK